jgi:hypothetical protein
MVTVLGHRGYLGAVVARRWREQGWDSYRFDSSGDYVICTFDDLPLIRRLAQSGPGAIVPSTDAIAEDTAYAARKRELEDIPGIVVIRSGIVDTRKANTHYDWLCNPLTPLEWADLAWEVKDQPGVHVAGRETTTRFDVGWAIAAAGLGPAPEPTKGGASDRCQIADRDRPSIDEALQEYASWLRA